MNKIINWVGGSFFRTIGRLLVYILLGFILSIILSKYDITGLFNILDVHANTIKTDGWIYNAEKMQGGMLFNWTSATNYSEINATWGYYDYPMQYDSDGMVTEQWQYMYKDGITLGSNGLSIGVQTGSYFYRTKLYHVTIYIGVDGGTVSRYASDAMTLGNVGATNDYSSMLVLEVECGAWSSFYSRCYQVDGIVQSQRSGNYIYARLVSSGSRDIAVFGYSSEYIGVIDQPTNSSIQSIVANSGFATATSVSQVQSSVNQVQQEIQGTQNAINQQTQQQQENHEETMNTITDDDTSEASSSASNFFSNFTTNQHGLTGIITAPLTAIQSLTSSTCSPLVLPLPFVNQNLTLPCMRPIYDQHFGGFMQLYDVITLGIISYWIMVRIFALVKDIKNPEHDEIEVVEL